MYSGEKIFLAPLFCTIKFKIFIQTYHMILKNLIKNNSISMIYEINQYILKSLFFVL